MTTEAWLTAGGSARTVALEVLRYGPLSRSEIARRLDLSAQSLTRLSAPLIDQGLLIETQDLSPERRNGRPSRPLDVAPGSRHFVGIKLTGEEVDAVTTDFRTSVVARAHRRLTDSTPAGAIRAIAELIEQLAPSVPEIAKVGVGVGGQVADGVVESAPFLGWTGVPFRELLQEHTGLDAVIENDLTALTVAEHWFGAGRGLDRFAVVTVGAGVGYGLVARGEVVTNHDAGLGLVGHWPVEPFGPLCPAGHRGCARAVLTTAAIEHAVSEALGRSIDYDGAITLAANGNPAARRVVDDAARGLGRLLGAVANLTMPQRIILGGEGVRLVNVAHAALNEGISESRDPRASTIDIATIAADNEDWCRGAAAVAIQEYVSSAA
jgi:predicted NBD/HSP70 family sugar kinase